MNIMKFRENFARIEQAVAHVARLERFPFLVGAILHNGQVWTTALGCEDADRQIPASGSTMFRIASITKLFTAISVMQLVEQGKLDLEDEIRAHLSEFAPANPFATEPTIRHLLTHRSGLVREPPVGHMYDESVPSLEQVIASLNKTKLTSLPGSEQRYSNLGFAVLGLIVARISGLSWPDYVRSHILRPAGMSRSVMSLAELSSPLPMTLMVPPFAPRFPARAYDYGDGPAGNMVSCAHDLSAFAMRLFASAQGRTSEPLLHGNSLRAMWSADPSGLRSCADRPEEYGLCFTVEQLEDNLAVGHAGLVPGFSSELLLVPDCNLAVILLGGLDDANNCLARLSRYAMQVLIAEVTGNAPPEFACQDYLSADAAEQIVGRYIHDGEYVDVIRCGERTMLDAPRLVAELRLEGGRVVIANHNRYIDDVRLNGNSIEFQGKKFFRGELASILPDPYLERYVGDYGPADLPVRILLRSGQLYAQIEWNSFDPLTAAGSNIFAFPATGSNYAGESLQFFCTEDRVTSVLLGGAQLDRTF